MSNTSDKTSCIGHKPISHYFVMYEDFLDVAKISEHQYKLAAFWRVLETKTNDRITYNEKITEDAKMRGLPIPETNLWIEIPYSAFVERSLGVYKSSSFQIAAAESERLGFHKSRTLTRRRNPLDPNSPPEDYKEYLFLTDVMQKAINEGEYPTPIDFNSPLLKSIAFRKEEKRKRAIENNTPPIEINSPQPSTPIEINTTAIEINRIIESTILPFLKDEKNKGTGIAPVFTERNAPSPISQLDASLEDFVMRASFEEWVRLHPENNTHSQSTTNHQLSTVNVDKQGDDNASDNGQQHSNSARDSSHFSLSSAHSDFQERLTPSQPQPSQITLPDASDGVTQSQPPMPPQKTTAVSRPSQGQIEALDNATPAQQNGELPDATSKQVPIAQGEATSKPAKAGKAGEPTKAQVEHVFNVITEVLRKLYEDEEFTVVQSQKATREVKNLIRAKASPERLKLVIKDMWNEKSNSGEYWWRRRGRMTVPAICEQYTSRAPGLGNKPTQERKGEQQATVQIAAGVVQGVTYQESLLERKTREMRESFMGTGRKVS